MEEARHRGWRTAAGPWLACALLALAGYLLNLAPLEVFPGIHFLFGGVFALVAAVRYGPLAGGLVGFVAALPSWSLWSQPLPLSALLYGLEGVWVGYATRGRRRGPLMAALAYWLLLGSWLNLGIQLVVTGLPFSIAFIIQCRSIINGLLVAVVVEIGFLVHGLLRDRGDSAAGAPRRPTFHSLLSLLLAALISLPILGITIRNARSFGEQRVEELREGAERAVDAIRSELGVLVRQYARGVETAAAIATGHTDQGPGFLQGLLEIIHRQFPEFAGLYVADRDARTVAFLPPVDERGESLVGRSYADRAYYRELLETRDTVYSGVYQARGGMTGPAVAIGAPILGEEGELAAFVLGWFDVRTSFQRLVERFEREGAAVVITDRKGRVLADSRSAPGEPDAVRDLSSEEAFQRQQGMVSATILATPKGDPSASAVEEVSARGSYLLAFTTEPTTGWRIWVDQSLEPIRAAMIRSARTHLLVLIGTLLLALLLGRGLARVLAAPLERLRESAERLASGHLSERPAEVAFPTAEIDSLFRSFSRMADGLDRSWKHQQRLLEEVSVSKRELEATFEAMTDAVVITDADDRVLHANQAFHEMGDLAPGYAIGRLLIDVSHPDGRWRDCRSCVARRSGTSATIQLAPEENATGRPIEVRVDQIRDREGEPVRSVQVIRDLTELRRWEAEAERAEALLRRDDKLRALGQLAAGVAHNFNNALTSVLGYVQLARSATADAEVDRSLETAEMAAHDAARMVLRIQQFARAEKEEPLRRAVLDRIVRDALELTRSRWETDAQAAGIRYRVRFPPGPERLVAGDPSALREVFVNLIINALDAMPRGGDLGVEITDGSETVSVSVTDDGCGMTSDLQERIFEPFFSTKGPSGQGMGLAVSYGTIRRHRGQIRVESEPGAGSRITVTLPALPERAEPATGGEGEAPRPDDAPRGSVLVAEDEAPIRGLVASLLESAHLRVETAADGAEALRKLTDSPAFDLVITDLAMPGADGMAVAREVRATSPSTRLLVMTGYGDRLREEGGEDGAVVDAWLAKPFDCSELMDRVEALLDGDGYRKRTSSTRSRPTSSISRRT